MYSSNSCQKLIWIFNYLCIGRFREIVHLWDLFQREIKDYLLKNFFANNFRAASEIISTGDYQRILDKIFKNCNIHNQEWRFTEK